MLGLKSKNKQLKLGEHKEKSDLEPLFGSKMPE